MGISKQNFLELYGTWIQHCLEKRVARNPNEGYLSDAEHSQIVTSFCFALSILGRRTLGAAAYNRHANAAESFLFGLHALFKGDLRVTSPLDEWVCCDPDILSSVISPAVRMALKLHQDHFAAADDFEEIAQLFERIEHYQSILFISHEHDPAWRQAIISNTPSLLALRHMFDDGQDDYSKAFKGGLNIKLFIFRSHYAQQNAFKHEVSKQPKSKPHKLRSVLGLSSWIVNVSELSGAVCLINLFSGQSETQSSNIC